MMCVRIPQHLSTFVLVKATFFRPAADKINKVLYSVCSSSHLTASLRHFSVVCQQTKKDKVELSCNVMIHYSSYYVLPGKIYT